MRTNSNTNHSNINEALTLLLANHQHVHENIKFADQKALVFIAINTGLLSVVYPLIKVNDDVSLCVGFATCAILSIGIGLAVFVITPRGARNRKRGKGVIDPERIYQFNTSDEFRGNLAKISDDELIAEMQTFVHDSSFINHQKYFYLRLSILVSSIGWLFALFLATWAKLFA